MTQGGRKRGAACAGFAYEAGLSARSARATISATGPGAHWRKAADGHEGELRLLSAIVPRDRIAIDVGANRGNYTFFLSRLAKQTIAYEPAPPMARFLREAQLPHVEVREAGVSKQPDSSPIVRL